MVALLVINFWLQVVIRVRPPLPRELQGFRAYQCTCMADADAGQRITISENLPAVVSGQVPADGMLYATYRYVKPWELGNAVSIELGAYVEHLAGSSWMPLTEMQQQE